MNERPRELPPKAVQRGLRLGVIEGAFAYATFTLTSGAVLASFVYSAGMSAIQYGLLTAMPFFAQLVQLPGVALLRKWQDRRAFTVLFASAGRLSLLGVAAALLYLPPEARPAAIFASFLAWSVCSAAAGGAWLWWMQDLVPPSQLGSYFGRRGSALVAISAPVLFASGFFLDWVGATGGPEGLRVAFAALFVTAASLGMVSSAILALMPHPAPAQDPRSVPLRQSLTVPFKDPNYRRLMSWLAIWWFLTTLTVPFFVVFLLVDLALSVAFASLLLLVGIGSTVIFLQLWGKLSDRFGNKPVLSICIPVLAFALMLSILLPTAPPLLAILVIVIIQTLMAMSAAGADLTAWNLALKLSKGPNAPAYLASASLVRALATGFGPIFGGLALFGLRGTAIPVGLPLGGPGPILLITRFPLLFVAASCGILLSAAFLARVKEEGEAPRHALLDALRLEADDGLMPGVRHFAAATTVTVRFIVDVQERAGATLDASIDAIMGALAGDPEAEEDMGPGPPRPG